MYLTDLITATDNSHSCMVGKISGLLATYAGYAPEEAALIGQAARFHDAGKIDIAPEILGTPGPLTTEEFVLVKAHTRLGADRIAAVMRVLAAAIIIAEQHHEHMDGGSGYIGLSGESIHPYARLVAAADVYDALVSSRSYKKALNHRDACRCIKERIGSQFDPKIAALLLAHADEVAALYTKDSEE